VGSRIRRVLQYADSIDKSVEILLDSNNGLYTNEWLLADWRYGSKIPAHHRMEPPNTIFPSEEPRYEAHWTHLHFGDGTGEGIMSSVTPFSTAEELNAARNINLPCMMSGRGCHSLCDLLPDATRYRREHNVGGWGWNSGDWGIQPHDCN